MIQLTKASTVYYDNIASERFRNRRPNKKQIMRLSDIPAYVSLKNRSANLSRFRANGYTNIHTSQENTLLSSISLDKNAGRRRSDEQ